jgi:amino acid permease
MSIGTLVAGLVMVEPSAKGVPVMSDAQEITSAADKKAWLESHEAGYAKGLKPRQVNMIAIGGV